MLWVVRAAAQGAIEIEEAIIARGYAWCRRAKMRRGVVLAL